MGYEALGWPFVEASNALRGTSGIYMIYNHANTKCYIGSSVDIWGRLRNHVSSLCRNKHYNGKLQNAWNKHGGESFKCYLVESCSRDDLEGREQHFMDLFMPDVDGYNIFSYAYSAYGYKMSVDIRKKISDQKYENPPSARAICQLTLNGEVVESWSNAAKASRALGIDRVSITSACRGGIRHAGGFQWCYAEDLDTKRGVVVNEKDIWQRRPVSQFTLDGIFIASYATISEAADAENLNGTNISDACSGKTERCGKYQWCFVGDEINVQGRKYVYSKAIRVCQLNLDGALLHTWDSESAAANAVGTLSGTICNSCKSLGRNRVGQYRFCYESDLDLVLGKHHRSKMARRVVQYSPEGAFIKVWDSLDIAAKGVGLSNACPIRSACIGNQHVAAGYQWRYYTDDYSLNIGKRGHAGKVVLQLTEDGDVIREFVTITEASLAVGVSPYAVSNCLRGKTEHSAGYRWKYKDVA